MLYNTIITIIFQKYEVWYYEETNTKLFNCMIIFVVINNKMLNELFIKITSFK